MCDVRQQCRGCSLIQQMQHFFLTFPQRPHNDDNLIPRQYREQPVQRRVVKPRRQFLRWREIGRRRSRASLVLRWRDAPDGLVNRIDQRLIVDRLGDVGVHPRLRVFRHLIREGVGGQRQDRHLPKAARQRANPPRRFHAIHLWHPHIHQDHVELLPGCQPYRFRATVRQRHHVTGRLQEGTDYVAVYLDIVDQEHIPDARRGHTLHRARYRPRDQRPRRQLEPEHAAAARVRAVRVSAIRVGQISYRATHQPHDPRGYRQTNACSFDRSRFVQAFEILEQTVSAGFIDAAAGISDLNPQSAR